MRLAAVCGVRTVVTEPQQRCGAMETSDAHDVMSPSNAIDVITRTDGYLASSVTMETGRGGPSCPWHLQVMSPFDRARTTSYSTLIETMRLSFTVFGI